MNGLSIVRAVVGAALMSVFPAVAETLPAPPAAGHAAPGKPAAPPVVTAPPNAHAQKPAATKPAAAKPGKPAAPAPAAKPAEPPPPPPAAAVEKPAPPVKGTGLPLPRWASLRADEVNLRNGPGTRYPIEWVYHRRDLPVQIEREFEGWRLIEDPDGVKGWVHQATLVGRRSFMVRGEHLLRRTASAEADPVARLKPGVVGHLRACEAGAGWCEVQAGEYRGFLRRDEIYGIYPGEQVN